MKRAWVAAAVIFGACASYRDPCRVLDDVEIVAMPGASQPGVSGPGLEALFGNRVRVRWWTAPDFSVDAGTPG